MSPRVRVSEKTRQRYVDQLELAKRRWEAEAEPTITKMNAYFRGAQWPAVGNQETTMPRLVANLIYADLKVMLPTLALRNPRVFVKPIGATKQMPYMTDQGPVNRAVQIINGKAVPTMDAAHAKEALANWRWRELRINQQVRRVVTDALLGPWGIAKLGHTLETEKVAPPAPDEAGEGQGEQLVVQDAIKADHPYAVRWDPRLVRVDPECRYPTLEDAAWLAFGFYARPEDLKRNPRYKNTRGLEATVPLKLEYSSIPHGDRNVPEELYRCLVWEIWDKREGTLLTLVDDQDAVLEYRDWPLKLDGFPARTLCFTEYPDQLYGPPDLFHILSQQDIYNELTSQIVNHVHRIQRKYAAQTGSFEEKELAKLTNPIDGLIVMTNGNPATSIVPIQDAPIPVDWWQSKQQTLNDHDRVSGIADFVRGQAEKVDTATEASYIQSALNVRTNDTRGMVETFAAELTKVLLAIDAQTLDVPKAIPVIGPDGAIALNEYVHVAVPEWLQAEVDVEVEIGSMQPVNQMLRKQDILQVYGMLRGDPLVDQFELRRRLIPAYQDSIPDLERVFLTPEQYQQMHEAMANQPTPPKVAVNLRGELMPDLAAQLAGGQPPPQPPAPGLGGPPGGPVPRPMPRPGRPGPRPMAPATAGQP